MLSARNLYCHECEKRGGSQKPPLMDTRLSLGKPTASQNVLSQSTEAASVAGAYRFRMSPVGASDLQGKPALFEGEVLIVHLHVCHT